jgi:hypothetical protein
MVAWCLSSISLMVDVVQEAGGYVSTERALAKPGARGRQQLNLTCATAGRRSHIYVHCLPTQHAAPSKSSSAFRSRCAIPDPAPLCQPRCRRRAPLLRQRELRRTLGQRKNYKCVASACLKEGSKLTAQIGWLLRHGHWSPSRLPCPQLCHLWRQGALLHAPDYEHLQQVRRSLGAPQQHPHGDD